MMLRLTMSLNCAIIHSFLTLTNVGGFSQILSLLKFATKTVTHSHHALNTSLQYLAKFKL